MYLLFLKPYVIFVTTPYLISSFVGNINSFNSIFLLTGGGPAYTGYQAGGTDLLVKPIESFCNFFEQHKEDNFLDYFLQPGFFHLPEALAFPG